MPEPYAPPGCSHCIPVVPDHGDRQSQCLSSISPRTRPPGSWDAFNARQSRVRFAVRDDHGKSAWILVLRDGFASRLVLSVLGELGLFDVGGTRAAGAAGAAGAFGAFASFAAAGAAGVVAAFGAVCAFGAFCGCASVLDGWGGVAP